MNSLPLPMRADHPAYAGHFPGNPILPGVVLLDAAIHALALQHGLDAAHSQIKSAKFASPVSPGEDLSLNSEPTAPGSFRFEIVAAGRTVASGAIAFVPPGQ